MGKKRVRRTLENPTLEMTPMIDVVFQLLIFFIVTLKQEDILSHLDVSRPAPDSVPPKVDEDIKLLDIIVWREGFVLKGMKVDLQELDRQLARMASLNKNVSVVIKCVGDSPHSKLVQLLDICAKRNLKNIAVFSM